MLGLPVVFHPEAVEETKAARLWYAERSQSAADTFLGELDPSPKRPIAGHCLCTTLAVICSIGFRSR